MLQIFIDRNCFQGNLSEIFLKCRIELLMLMVYIFLLISRKDGYLTLQHHLYPRINIFLYIVCVAQYKIHIKFAAASLFNIRYSIFFGQFLAEVTIYDLRR